MAERAAHARIEKLKGTVVAPSGSAHLACANMFQATLRQLSKTLNGRQGPVLGLPQFVIALHRQPGARSANAGTFQANS